MKKAIIALIVLILAAGGSVGAFLAVKNGKEKEKQQASKVLAENELFSFDPYSPTKIVFSKGDEVYEVEKQDDKWTLTSGEFAMDQDYCQLICTYFSDLTAETNYGEITDEKLEMYGLTDPDTIEVTEPGGTHILKVGDPSPMGDYYYVTVDGRDKVYAISYMEGSVLKLDRLLLKNKELLTYSLYDIKEVIVKKDGKTTLDLSFDPDTQEWSLPDEYSSLKVDPTMITTVLNNLVRLESEEMLDEKLEDLSKYGHDKPYGELIVKGIDGTERKLSISFNDEKPDYCMVLFEDGQVELYYKADLSIVDKTPYDFIVQNTIAADSASTKKLQLSYNGNDDTFEIDMDNQKCKVNGKEVAIDTMDNYVAFDNFFKAASVYNFAGLDIEAKPQLKDPVMTAKFTDTDGKTVKMDLVTRDDSTLYVFKDGKYIGAYVNDTMLKGRTSLSEFYIKFKKIANF